MIASSSSSSPFTIHCHHIEKEQKKPPRQTIECTCRLLLYTHNYQTGVYMVVILPSPYHPRFPFIYLSFLFVSFPFLFFLQYYLDWPFFLGSILFYSGSIHSIERPFVVSCPGSADALFLLVLLAIHVDTFRRFYHLKWPSSACFLVSLLSLSTIWRFAVGL